MIIEVKFPSNFMGNGTPYYSNGYRYINKLEEEIEVDDWIIVPVGKYNTPTVAKVTKVGLDNKKASKYVIGIVDLESYNALMEREARQKAIVAALTKIEKETMDRQRFSYLAKMSPEAAALLSELDELEGEKV